MNTVKESESKETRRYILLSQILGQIAMWAVRQSPYRNPEGLADVLSKFSTDSRDIFDANEMVCLSRVEISDMLKRFLMPIEQFRKWNERKNGNQSPYGFVSLYYKPNPDDDFIDLDALIMNVTREVWRESE